MYFWLAKNIKCILPSRTSLTSSAADRDRWIAMSASCLDTSAERIAQWRSTRIFGNDCWNSTRRGASQNVPKPSVMATRTSPERVLVTELPLKILDSPADPVDRELKLLSCGSETSAAHHLQKNSGCVPIGETSERN